MIFDKDKEKNDYFDSEEIIEEKPKPEKRPSYRPDDPAYWEEESDWDHLKPGSGVPLWIWVVMSLVIIGIIIAGYLRYFSPYIEEATQYGYVEHIEKRGTIFKTYEGVLIPYKELRDTTRLYNRDFVFSVDNEKTATELKRAQFAARPVRITYKKYHATLPWRGSSKIIVTETDSVDPSKILPPEFTPEIMKK